MTVLLDQFVQTLSDSGLMSADETRSIMSRLSAKDMPENGEQLAKLLCRQGKLTKFQAEAIYRGKHKGLILGDYALLEQIGQGGMGQVFRAQHRRMKRIVALKTLPKELTKSPEAIGRFQQEVEAAAKLIHPNVATAFDAGEANHVHYLVMEYVDGEDLRQVIARRGPIGVGETIHYVLQVARGLEYAHQQGVVHRDIKPSNLLLDRSGTVKILDMGLARVARSTAGDDPTLSQGLTQTGDIMGTVDYMAPEQSISTKNVDHRADIYSLGCTLFYLLTARPLYEGQTAVEKVLAHRDQPIPSLRKLRDDIPQSLEVVFRRMVAKKPELRQRSMSEVIAALEKCDAGGRATTVVRMPASGRTQEEAKRTFKTERQLDPPTGTPKVSRNERHQREVHQVKELQRRNAQRKVWEDTVHSAIVEQDRKARWLKVKRWTNILVSGAVQWLIIIGVLGALAYAGFVIWPNYRKIESSRNQVLVAMNARLMHMKFDALKSLEFTNSSLAFKVPESLAFECPVFQTTVAGTSQIGVLKGEFERRKGVIHLLDPFRSDIQAEAVP